MHSCFLGVSSSNTEAISQDEHFVNDNKSAFEDSLCQQSIESVLMKNKLCINFEKKRPHLESLSHFSSGRSMCPLDFTSWFLGESSPNTNGDQPNQFQ